MSARLVPDIAFPAYSYVPGRFPHPHSDPAGHRFKPDANLYLLGIDLFNHGYYWEAHEAWESLWHAAGRHGRDATFYKGLIQLAVAGVKVREGRAEGVLAHASRAAELFAGLDCDRCIGLRLSQLIEYAKQIVANPPTMKDPMARAEVVFAFTLQPEAT